MEGTAVGFVDGAADHKFTQDNPIAHAADIFSRRRCTDAVARQQIIAGGAAGAVGVGWIAGGAIAWTCCKAPIQQRLQSMQQA